MTKTNPVADYIEAKAAQFAGKADDNNPSTDHIRYRHYSQALTMIATELRAEMHVGEEPAQ